SITDRNSNTTTFTYYRSDSTSHDGNLKEIITPSGPNSAPSRTYTFHYDFFDNVIKVTDPLSNEWEYEFDDDNRPTKITDALNNYVDMTYEDNRLSEISAPANSSSVYRRRTQYEYLVRRYSPTAGCWRRMAPSLARVRISLWVLVSNKVSS
ncbi:MAG: RHS repeat protein, partial [Candidatus Eremiobacteraeota bacterium]|nr:RHS repeat protein [Candidatus Eremiobacteraeota bacterium]